MESSSSIMAVLALLILLAATSIRFGADSRKRFSTDDHEHTSRGSR